MTKFGKKAGIPQEESIDRTPKGKPRVGKISVSPGKKAPEQRTFHPIKIVTLHEDILMVKSLRQSGGMPRSPRSGSGNS